MPTIYLSPEISQSTENEAALKSEASKLQFEIIIRNVVYETIACGVRKSYNLLDEIEHTFRTESIQDEIAMACKYHFLNCKNSKKFSALLKDM